MAIERCDYIETLEDWLHIKLMMDLYDKTSGWTTCSPGYLEFFANKPEDDAQFITYEEVVIMILGFAIKPDM
jgi:hypothetical protein